MHEIVFANTGSFIIFFSLRKNLTEEKLKAKIHPKYFDTTIKCACGNAIETRSTVKDISVEICSSCHPFFTGKQKLIDTAGRVERFRRKYGNRTSSTDKKE